MLHVNEEVLLTDVKSGLLIRGTDNIQHVKLSPYGDPTSVTGVADSIPEREHTAAITVGIKRLGSPGSPFLLRIWSNHPECVPTEHGLAR